MDELLADNKWLELIGRANENDVFDCAPLEDADSDHIIWLRTDMRDVRHEWSRSALMLLAMVGRLDPKIWQEQAERILQVSCQRWAHLQKKIEDIRWNGPLLGRAISLWNHSDWTRLSDMYLSAIRIPTEWLDQYGAIEADLVNRIETITGMTGASLDFRTPLLIECGGSNADLSQVRLLAMADSNADRDECAARTTATTQAQRVRRNARYLIRQLRIQRSSGFQMLDFTSIQHLKAIIEYGVRVHNFVMFRIFYPEEQRDELLAAFQVLFPSDQSSRGIEHVVVSSSSTTELLPAFMSCLRFCQSVRTVTISTEKFGSEAERTAMWRWVAYALFCRGSCHTVGHLKIETPIEEHELAAMRQILQARNPLAALMDGDATSTPGGQVQARRFYFDRPTCMTPAIAPDWTSATALAVDVMVSGLRDRTWWHVLLPGYGLAWVYRKDVEQFTPADELPPPPGITSLEYEAADHHFASLVELLGTSLTAVSGELASSHGVTRPEWIDHAIQLCPRLYDLRLPTAPLSAACLSQVTASQSVRLHSFRCSIRHDGYGIELVRFFSLLSVDQHRFTARLTNLHIQVHISHRDDLAFLRAVVEMLQRNESLVNMSLTIVDHGYDGHQQDRVWSMLSPFSEPGHHTAMLSYQPVEMPMSAICRLAFLSVLAAAREGRSVESHAMMQLDSAVVATILSFAARRYTRRVQLRYIKSDATSVR